MAYPLRVCGISTNDSAPDGAITAILASDPLSRSPNRIVPSGGVVIAKAAGLLSGLPSGVPGSRISMIRPPVRDMREDVDV